MKTNSENPAIKVAEHAGFCSGVTYTVNKTFSLLEKYERVFQYGELTHNENVISELESNGVIVLKPVLSSFSEYSFDKNDVIVIRSHGITEEEYEYICKIGAEVVDTTCINVKKIHEIVRLIDGENEEIIIAGDPNHPEVKGIMGWCKNPVRVISEPEDITKENFSHEKMYFIVSQTTFNDKKYKYIVEKFNTMGYNYRVNDTICMATKERQAETLELSQSCEAVIVIGGKDSSNTRKLYEIAKSNCENTYYIQDINDLEHLSLDSFRSVGITAGASTPRTIIKEAILTCKKVLKNY
ncbi:MAG: 4-hydroxy-3-methylbut-2-enyl diphosphate reductase [Lachnospiraceae bacterium]|nr:4-hydroxy-3-methylbut-2-enyl diphosphate reductase [Lachnospiraceae bacterium]